MNTDPRYTATKQILENIDGYGIPLKLYKTTRAGATTGLTANCIDSNASVLLIAPTKKIAHETIKESIIYSERGEANIQVLLSNHECLLNKAMVHEYPDVGKLPILPLPKKCSKCEFFDQCPITALVRSAPDEVDGIGITYQKLQAIMFSDSETANMVKGRLARCDVIIFDEAHVFEAPDTVSLQVYPRRSLQPYQTLFKDNGKISPFLESYAKIVHDKEVSIMQLVLEHDNAEKNLMSITIHDPLEQIDFKKVIGALKEIIKIMKNRNDYGLSVEDVLYIFNIVMLFAADRHVLHYIKNDIGGCVYLSTTDSLLPAVRMFKTMIDPSLKKKMIFTTATFGDFDYTSVFGFHDHVLMPDVMNANRRMIIYPDSFKMDSINYHKKHWNRIVESAILYEKKYPGITFICMKKKVAQWLWKQMEKQGFDIKTDYYRSDKMIGVASDKRMCVCVGAPVAPINTYDGVSDTYEESQKKRVGNNHAAFWQAISRFKSPSGREDSKVFCIGVTKKDIDRMVMWGTDRKLSIHNIHDIDVNVDVAFDSPMVVDKKQQKVYDTIVEMGEVTRSMIMRKHRMKSDDVMTYVDSLLKDGRILSKTSDMKRNPIMYTAKL